MVLKLSDTPFIKQWGLCPVKWVEVCDRLGEQNVLEGMPCDF